MRQLHSVAFSAQEWEEIESAGQELYKETGINPYAKEVILSCLRRRVSSDNAHNRLQPTRPPPGRPHSTTFTNEEWQEITSAREVIEAETGIKVKPRIAVMYYVRRYLASR